MGEGESGLVERAHSRGLVVHAYTFRNEVRPLAHSLHKISRMSAWPASCRSDPDAQGWLAPAGAAHWQPQCRLGA